MDNSLTKGGLYLYESGGPLRGAWKALNKKSQHEAGARVTQENCRP